VCDIHSVWYSEIIAFTTPRKHSRKEAPSSAYSYLLAESSVPAGLTVEGTVSPPGV